MDISSRTVADGPGPQKKAKEGEKEVRRKMVLLPIMSRLTRSCWVAYCRDQGRVMIRLRGTETRRPG